MHSLKPNAKFLRTSKISDAFYHLRGYSDFVYWTSFKRHLNRNFFDFDSRFGHLRLYRTRPLRFLVIFKCLESNKVNKHCRVQISSSQFRYRVQWVTSVPVPRHAQHALTWKRGAMRACAMRNAPKITLPRATLGESLELPGTQSGVRSRICWSNTNTPLSASNPSWLLLIIQFIVWSALMIGNN